MLNYDNFAITLARGVAVLRENPPVVAEQKAALRALLALTSLGPADVAIKRGRLQVQGKTIPATLPLIRELTQQLTAHAISEIRFAEKSSAADLLHLLRALAGDPGPRGADGHFPLNDFAGGSVSVVSVPAEQVPDGRRPVSVTEAFKSVPEPEAAPAVAQAPGPEPPPAAARPAEPRRDGKKADPLDAAIIRLFEESTGSDLRGRLHDMSSALAQIIGAGDIGKVMTTLNRLLDREAAIGDDSVRGEYNQFFSRILDPPLLEEIARLLPDSRHTQAASVILRRAGSDGENVLLARVASARTPAARRAYFEALGGPAGTLDTALKLLDHRQWMVVRNAAELLGELHKEAAIPALTRCLGHHELEVREAAGVALARIGTAAAVEPLRRALRDSDPEVRLSVAGAIAGRGLGGLVNSLAMVADGERTIEFKQTYYRALGRIGTPDAVSLLVKAVQAGGRFIGRRSVPLRLAGIEGLREAAGPAVLGTLERLLNDTDADIREAARVALGEVRTRPSA